MDLLNVSGISRQQDGVLILKEIHFHQQRFQKIAVSGETGSGKSTLLKIIAGLVQPTAGKVLFGGKRVAGPDEKLIPGHPGIGYVSQHFELRNNYRVEEELAYTNQLTDKAAARIYEICQIGHLLNRRTNQLSGGERQRIVTARVLIASPQLLLLDEPFSNLDMAHTNTMKTVIQDIGEQLKITCMLVSHDPLDTLSWADKIIVIREGQLIQEGSPQEIYRQPVNEYTAALFGKYNLIKAAHKKKFEGLPGVLMNDKNLLVRPGQFELTTKEKGIRGTVNNIIFYGSYYELEVLVSGITMTINTGNAEIKKGDTIYLSILPGSAWYFD
jgi:ABC-type sugar transport system ATPase subunit